MNLFFVKVLFFSFLDSDWRGIRSNQSLVVYQGPLVHLSLATRVAQVILLEHLYDDLLKLN